MRRTTRTLDMVRVTFGIREFNHVTQVLPLEGDTFSPVNRRRYLHDFLCGDQLHIFESDEQLILFLVALNLFIALYLLPDLSPLIIPIL